jgi:O-palmitoleoyl-L-serine hydrolase
MTLEYEGFLTFIAVLLLASPLQGHATTVGQGIYLTNNNYDAKCMDGSPPIYWIIKGSGSGAKKWLISFEEGGFCNLINGGYDNCYYFAYEKNGGYLGTSNSPIVPSIFNFSVAYENYFSRNRTTNPIMYNWNMVYMHYCDGSLWLGNVTGYVMSKGTKMYIRGNANAMAILNDLMENQGFADAQSVIVTGQSVGGVAAYNYVDNIAAMFTGSTRVVGMPDSGFFLPVNYAPCNYLTQLELVYYNFSTCGSLHDDCLSEQALNPWLCQTAKYMIPVIKTPIYALQSRYDSSNYDYILCDNTNQTAIYDFTNLFAAAFYGTGITDVNGINGAFLDNCPHHYYVYNLSVPEPVVFQPWTTVVSTIGISQSSAFVSWYDGSMTYSSYNQTPVPHEIDFAYCSSDWMTNQYYVSPGSGPKSLQSGEVVAIIICVLTILGVFSLWVAPLVWNRFMYYRRPTLVEGKGQISSVTIEL